MKILLTLVLFMVDGGPKQTALEMPTIEECWARAHAIIERADMDKMREAGVGGVGAGCVAIVVPQQETNEQ